MSKGKHEFFISNSNRRIVEFTIRSDSRNHQVSETRYRFPQHNTFPIRYNSRNIIRFLALKLIKTLPTRLDLFCEDKSCNMYLPSYVFVFLSTCTRGKVVENEMALYFFFSITPNVVYIYICIKTNDRWAGGGSRVNIILGIEISNVNSGETNQ